MRCYQIDNINDGIKEKRDALEVDKIFILKFFKKFKKKNNEIKSCPKDGIFVLKGQVNNDMACEVIKGMAWLFMLIV